MPAATAAAAQCAPFSTGVFGFVCAQTGVPSLLLSALFSALLVLGTGLAVRRALASASGGVIPDQGFTFRNAVEWLVGMLAGLARANMGENWRRYFPLVGTLFLFILFSNLFGLIPWIDGATSDANTTWAWALISFLAHQYVGVREHGFGYINHFLGPAMFKLKLGGRTFHVRPLFPLYAPIEIIGHLSRVFTLAVRLLANMFADHTVVAVWVGLVPAVLPALFMGMGVLVSFLQAYVFAMLSMIYIGLALQHDH